MVCGALMQYHRLAKLRRACITGDLPAAKCAIAEGVWINAKDLQSHTPLSLAITHHHWDIALALLAAQADPNVFPPSSKPLLELATESKRLDIVEAMLDAQCIPPTDGRTPLHLACKFGHTTVVEKLAAARVDVNRLDSFGQTPLQICLDAGVPAPTFERLLEAGADVNYDPFLLLQACIADPTDHAIAVASVLIAGGADVNGVCDGLSPSLLTTTAWSDTEREISVTPLNAACICEHKEIIKLLLAAGADANLTPQTGGTTPLYEASLHGNAEIVQLLLDAGAEVDASGSMADDTPLKAASRRGHVQVVKLLLEAKSRGEANGGPGVSIPHAEVVQYLLDTAKHESSSAVYQQLLLLSACERGHVDVVRAMVDTGMDLNMLFRDGMSPLGVASSRGHTGLVRLLLATNVSVDLLDRSGETALFHAVREGHSETIELLLEAHADPAFTSKAGVSLLSLALREHAHVTTILDLLLAAGVDPNRHDKDLGTTPLVFASLRLYSHSGALRTLLEGGARPQLLGTCPFKVLGVSMVSPLAALFLSLERNDPHGTSDYAVYEMAYLLACHGAVWTDDCELLLRKQLAPVQTLATIRACFKDWSTDPNASSIRGLLDVPREVIERGYHAVGAYLSAMRASGASGVVLRRKVCVVGPSCWGKTSLVRSITTRAPSLVHEDDRTIGIDLFAWTFPDDTSRATHQVTLWDFAGQDEYQAAHTLFFSRRTLFLVCVDVGAYAEALRKLETSHDADREHATVEMDAFVAANLTRWVRTIFARQPDVQFALVLTKADAVGHNTAQLAQVEADVRARLACVRETVCTEIKRAIRKLKSTRVKTSHEITRLRSLKQKAASNLSPTACVAVSCKGAKWVLKAQRDLRRVVCDARHQSFCMPETYSRVLHALVASRPPANDDAGVRVRATFVKLDAVYDSLTAQPGLQSLTKETCTEILRILHDLGDVLWYEELHASPLLCKTLVLEPQLLLEFLRQVVNHHHAPGRVGDLLTHKTLRALPYWSAIRDDEALLLALKTLLHHVQLAYPTRRAPMVWDSDLIVPCYWRRSRVVARQGDRNSLSLSLRDPPGGVACRVRFDYELGAEPPETLFEHLAVTTYSTLCARTVESDRRIVFGSPDPAAFACRLWTRREVASGVVVRIEAVASDRHSSTADWQIFQHACTAMETVLVDYPGLLVTRSALDDSDTGVALDDLVAHLATLSPDKEIRPSQPWLPPDLTWYRTKPWLCAATTTLPPLIPSDVQVIVDRIDAMDAKLVQLAKGGSRADYPTLWTLTYTTTTPSTIATSSAKAKAGRLVVRVLSDVSGKCWHEPLELTVASKWLTQYGGAIKLGISVLANAAATAPVVGGVLQAAFNLAAAELDSTLRTARPVHNLITDADLSANETLDTSQHPLRGQGLLPDEATQLLVDVLTARDPKFTPLKISGLTKLERCVTTSGAFVWAHRSEIDAAAAGTLVRSNELPRGLKT